MKHNDRVHLFFGFVVFGDVSINRIVTEDFVVFLSRRDNRLGDIGKVKTHPVHNFVCQSDHLISNLI